MKKLLTALAVFTSFFVFSQPALANECVAGGSAVLKNEFWGIENPDPRAEKLEAFLEKFNSPLAPFAQNFVEAADQYDLDWKLVPSITGVESTFGKNVPFNSYNAYGWANGAYAFESWEQSIDHVSRVLKEKYIDRGLDTPYKMGPIYAPPSRFWAGKVVYFMDKIENYGLAGASEIPALTI